MPNIKSAKKALRKSLKNKIHNLFYKNKIKLIKKQIQKAILNKKKDQATELLKKFYKIVDKAEKEKIIKKNKAARLKSRMSKKINSPSLNQN